MQYATYIHLSFSNAYNFGYTDHDAVPTVDVSVQ